MKFGEFSVLMTVYQNDRVEYLQMALASLTSQSLLPSQIVIVQDGPICDLAQKAIEIWSNSYFGDFDLIKLEKNVGLGAALSNGLRFCKYEIVARMDADDICFPNRMNLQFEFLLNNPDITAVGATVEEFNNTPGDLLRFRKLPTNPDELKKFALKRNPMNHPSVMFRKVDIMKAGGYDDCLLFEDYLLWLKLLSSGKKIANIPEPLLYFRIGNNMIGRRSGRKYLRLEWNFYKKCRQLGVLSNGLSYKMFFMRAPFRIIPKSLLTFLYTKFLR